VLQRFSVSLTEGEFFCLLGPSGCGKTTVLNLMAGFLEPFSGMLTLAGRPIRGPGLDRTVVFQGDDALFNWLRTIDNVAFGLRMQGMSKGRRHAVARDYLHLVHLGGQENKYPGELSGGMKQRVQIARVLASDPKVLLMDEPFGALDAQTRGRMQSELVEIWHKTGKTIVFIYPRYHRGGPAGGSHRRHDQGAGIAARCNHPSRPAAAAPAQQSRLRRDVGTHQRADRERRGEWTMTELSPAGNARPVEAVAPAPRLPLGGIKRDHLIYVVSIIGLIMLWHLIATTFFKPQFFPPPLLVLSTGREMLESGELMEHVSISLQRILAGFLIGSAIAAPAGLLMGSIPVVRAIFDPYVQFFRFVPSLAWLTPVVIWFGIGETSKVLIIVYTTIFIVLINTMVGVSHIAPNKLRAAACLGATPRKAFIFVTLPATLPFILTGMRLAMGNSFATVVAAEMIAADSGLGYLIFNSRLWMATDKIFIGIVCLGALGLITDRLFRYLIVRFAHQYGPIE
jgi:NitT/TauT family transport system permease protein